MKKQIKSNQPKHITKRIVLLQKKSDAGKLLNGEESAFLEKHVGKPISIAPDGEAVAVANNVSHLATLLGIPPQRIRYFVGRDGAPKILSVAEWTEFLLTHGKGKTLNKLDGGQISKLRAEQILLQNEKLRDQIFVSRGELIPKVIAQQVFGKLLLAVKSATFTSIGKFVMLARMAPDNVAAGVEIQKELVAIWKNAEDSKWLKNKPNTP